MKDEKFFKWKKIFVRSTHMFLVLFITASLFLKETELRKALVLRNYSYIIPYVFMVYLSLLFYFLTCLTSPGYVKLNNHQNNSNASETNLNNDSASSSEETFESSNRINLVDLSNKSKRTDNNNKKNRDTRVIQINSTDGESSSANESPTIKLRFCDTCKIEQPIRSRHCEECGRCIRKFDHHCPWLETCIGEKNHGYFWLFLLVTNVLILWTIVIVCRAFRPVGPWVAWFIGNFYYLFCMHILLVSLLVCMALFLIHTYFMLNNTTTWERFSRKNITYLKVINDDKFNPFYENYCRNVAHFFSCGFTRGGSSCTRSGSDDERRWDNVYVKYMKSKFSNHNNKTSSTNDQKQQQHPATSDESSETVVDIDQIKRIDQQQKEQERPSIKSKKNGGGKKGAKILNSNPAESPSSSANVDNDKKKLIDMDDDEV